MNFLSHYYFESDNNDADMVLGAVLPDLVKNAGKGGNLYPFQYKGLFESAPQLQSIYLGWERHLKVDALFHSSDFFKVHSQKLKAFILPALEDSPVKPFFLSHVGLELILDHLLTVNEQVDINAFYNKLSFASRESCKIFLEICDYKVTDPFFDFLNNFISSKYLLSYQKTENIAYALDRICMRLWDNPFDQTQVDVLTEGILLFKDEFIDHYHLIFKDIEQQLR